MKKLLCLLLLVFFTHSYAADVTPPPTPPPQTQEVVPLQPELPPDTPSYEHAFLKMILSLVGLLVLVFLTFWALRRLSQGRMRFMNQNLTIKILEKRSLSPKTLLYVLEIGGKKLLISESQLEVRLLTPIEESLREQD